MTPPAKSPSIPDSPTASDSRTASALRTFLLNPKSYGKLLPSIPEQILHRETHISDIFLTGEFVLKLKKAVSFGFLDFGTLESRKRFCELELQVNREFSPELYLKVLPIYRLPNGFDFSPAADAEVVEYAVFMKQFDESQLLSALASRNGLSTQTLLQLADEVARIHGKAKHRPDFGGPDGVRHHITDNFSALKNADELVFSKARQQALFEKMLALLEGRRNTLEARRKTFVRELHGDLHLGNIYLEESGPKLFDGIEFSESLRCVDTLSDLAFLLMDLRYRGPKGSDILVRNRYLEKTNDYAGAELLPLFLSYRATVRAKVAELSAEQHLQDRPRLQGLKKEVVDYLTLAEKYLTGTPPILIAVGGLSGSGKSTIASALAQRIDAYHLRSDVIRKQLLHIDPEAQAPESAYQQEISEKTYQALFSLASQLLSVSEIVIVDAVFLKADTRDALQQLALKQNIPFLGFWCEVQEDVALKRIRLRQQDASDATEQVYRLQVQQDVGKITWQKIQTSQEVSQILPDLLSRIAPFTIVSNEI